MAYEQQNCILVCFSVCKQNAWVKKRNFTFIGANWQLELRRILFSKASQLLNASGSHTNTLCASSSGFVCLSVTSDMKSSISLSYPKAFRREIYVALLLNSHVILGFGFVTSIDFMQQMCLFTKIPFKKLGSCTRFSQWKAGLFNKQIKQIMVWGGLLNLLHHVKI